MYADITGCTGIESVTYHQGYDQPTATLQVVCTAHTLGLNDLITGDIGYTASHGAVFYGRVKEIRTSRSADGFKYAISCFDILIQASDYFIVADDPDNPYQADNVAAEDLVEALLNMAQITDYASTSPGLTLSLNIINGDVSISSSYIIVLVESSITYISYFAVLSLNTTRPPLNAQYSILLQSSTQLLQYHG